MLSNGFFMPNASDNSCDAILAKTLKTPPGPFTPKAKPKPSPKRAKSHGKPERT